MMLNWPTAIFACVLVLAGTLWLNRPSVGADGAEGVALLGGGGGLVQVYGKYIRICRVVDGGTKPLNCSPWN
jgi:hypothetical protein